MNTSAPGSSDCNQLENSTFSLTPLPFNGVKAAPLDGWQRFNPQNSGSWTQALLDSAESGSFTALWCDIPVSASRHAEALRHKGFTAHSVNENVLKMYKWLDSGSDDRIPRTPHTQVAVGAVCVHHISGTILVVREHNKRTGWKLPGGVLDQGEGLNDCA